MKPSSGGASPQSSGRLVWWLLTSLLLIFCVFVRWRLLDVPLERDEGEFAYIGQLLLEGIPPYGEAYTLKLPGTSLVYALIMLAFGQSAPGIHLGLLLINLASIVLLGFLTARLFNEHAALAAAACYALLSLSMGVSGGAAHATHFTVLFTLAGFLLLLRHLDGGRLWLLLAGGVCLGLAIVMKQHAVTLAGFSAAYYFWRVRSLTVSRGTVAVKVCLYLLSLSLPLLLVVAWVILAGRFSEFWFWTVRYSLDYATRLSVAQGAEVFAVMFGKILDSQLAWWLLAAAGVVALLLRPQLCRDRLLLFGLLGFSFLATCPGFYFRGHYFILLLPAVAMSVAAIITALDPLMTGPGRSGWLRLAVPGLLLVLAAGTTIYRERAYLLELPPERVSRLVYDLNPFPESPVVARYLQEQTLPTDRIAVLGSEPQIYFYAKRKAASRHIYMYGLVEPHRHAAEMQRELIGDIERVHPNYLLFVGVPSSWLVDPAAPDLLFAWLDDYLAKHFTLAGTVAIGVEGTAYSFAPATVDADPQTDAALFLYRRSN